MSETTQANDAIHGVAPGDGPHAAGHGEDNHGDAAHGGHANGASLGPVDWRAWGAGLLGIGAGLVVAACLFIATNF